MEAPPTSLALKQSSPPSAEVAIALAPMWLALSWLVWKTQWFWSHNPEMAYGWMVLFLSVFLIWDQWKHLPSPVYKLRWPFYFFALAGSAMLFLVQIYQATYGTMAALISGLAIGVLSICAANLHFVFGWRGIRFFAFPLLFLLIALPLPSVVYNFVVGGLQSRVTACNVEILNLIGIPAQRVGSLIQLPNGTVGVDEACSGIRSLQSTIMATLFIGYMTLKKRGAQIALFFSGIAFAFVGNLIRSLFLCITANREGVEAVKKVHDSAGWSILIFTAAGVALLSWIFSKIEKIAERERVRVQQEEASLAGSEA
jgi:exosortase